MFLSFTTELILGGNTATTQGRALVATVLSEVGTMWEKGDLGMDTVKSSVISLVCWEDLVKHPSHFTTTTHTPPFRPVGQSSTPPWEVKRGCVKRQTARMTVLSAQRTTLV
jgi:hypothetical protein